MPSSRARYLLPVFFLSGVSALLYQIVWLKYLGLVFGNTVYAAATLVAVYLAGLGIGAYLFGRRAWPANPLVGYALAEALIGTLAAFSPNAFGALDAAYVASFHRWLDAPAMLAVARLLAAAAVLLPPTILMGGTLPLLVRAFRRHDEPGHAVAVLYAANTFGATAGVALAGFVLIPRIGLLSTIFAGVVINFLLATVAAVLARRGVPLAGLPVEERPLERSAPMLLGATLLMGFTSIADEVFWSRILVLHLGSSVYAYSLMLFSFLIGLAAGSAAVDRVLRSADARRLVGLLEVALAASLGLQVLLFGRFADLLETFARFFGAASYNATLATFLSAVLCALLLPTALMGATFPLVVRLYERATGASEERAVGTVYVWNTLGSISGSLAAGFVLIRMIGSQNGLFVMALVNLALGALFLSGSRRSAAWTAAGGVVLALAIALSTPHGVILSAGLFTDQKAKLRYFREDTTATVTLREFAPNVVSLELNGVNVAGTSPDLIGTQKLQGHLPLLMHPAARSVLHIGFGSGGTAYAVSRHPVSNITIAEISPEVLETSDRFLRAVNHGVLHDPRVHARIADGRNYVLAAPEKFDVILSDSIHPRYAGNGSLYTRDYFELCKARLNANGMVSMWLPIYSLTPRNYLMILRAFRDVFPNTTVWYVPNALNAYTIVIGRLEPGALPLDRMQRQMSPAVGRELAGIGIGNAYDLASALLLDPAGVETITTGIEAHVDDVPAVEYESGRVIDRDGSWLRNFGMLTRNMTPLARAFRGVDDARHLALEQNIRAQRADLHLRQLTAAIRSSR